MTAKLALPRRSPHRSAVPVQVAVVSPARLGTLPDLSLPADFAQRWLRVRPQQRAPQPQETVVLRPTDFLC